MSHDQPVTIAILGAGNRSLVYSEYALQHPEKMRVVAVADPDEIRRHKAAKIFDIPAEACFENAEIFSRQPKMADAVINGTMDQLHVPTSIPVVEAGYHLLLEKPIAKSHEELATLVDAAQKTDQILMICHNLRHAPFYVAVQRSIAEGEIGRIMAIHTSENVGYDHMGQSFVRGKWNREEVCPMLLAKCCHDLDLICWLKSGSAPGRVSSFGSLMYFREENAPAGSGLKCLVDCEIESTCHYSARKNFIGNDRYSTHVWRDIEHIVNLTDAQKIEDLKADNPHGRCVWRCENDVVDHQSVMIEFDDGSVATHEMVGGTAKACRNIHVRGTEGEIEGTMEDGCLIIRKPDADHEDLYQEKRVEVDSSGDVHGGGDLRLVADFVRVVRGEQPSASTTHLMDSVYSHEIAYAADRAMRQGCVVSLGG
jgi:predicted dehydrogenase